MSHWTIRRTPDSRRNEIPVCVCVCVCVCHRHRERFKSMFRKIGFKDISKKIREDLKSKR